MSTCKRVLFCCTGVGIYNRGIESFFREVFDGLRTAPGLAALLVKGGGERAKNEIPIACLPRTGKPAQWLGRAIRRNGYVVEQLSSFPSVVSCIRRFRPHVVFYSDGNLGFQLFRWRKQIGVPFRLLFSNGGPCRPPFERTDFVHQVTPFYLDGAVNAGERAERHFMVPYGIKLVDPPVVDLAAQKTLRERLGLPFDRPVVLSVGWISRQHKRMDYVVREVARLPKPRPFLQLLGAMDESSQEIINVAENLLGRDGFSARSVTYEEVFDYYRAVDVFALASLQEGFGRVYVEALMHGLPVIAHRHPVMEYVLGGAGYLGDLNREGELAQLLGRLLPESPNEDKQKRRWMSVRDRFAWPTLAPQYAAMFAAVARQNVTTQS
jgi:1,2-diacylglycerol 3-alpha-glucosyltransferase